VRLDRLHLHEFRNYPDATLTFAPGLTALLGRNGQGKTNVLEAVAYLATMRSFRGATSEVLVRTGADRAVVRAEGTRGEDRDVLIEAEITPGGRNRCQVNRQRLTRARDLVGVLRVTVFTPDDLSIVKGGPQGRRDLLDTTLVSLDPRHDALQTDYERVIRQRNALLRQVGGRLSPEAALTLDVWDAKLAPLGERLAEARLRLAADLEPHVRVAYHRLAAAAPDIVVAYRPSFELGTLDRLLEAGRNEEVRRGTTLVGPHRDDLEVSLAGQPARSHGSQGEQRSLALALKLAAHALVTEVAGAAPLLLLDDVFSELDPRRAAALVAHLPPGQAVLSSADALPPGAVAELTYRVEQGRAELEVRG